MNHTIDYDASFIIFWGLLLGAFLFLGGILYLTAMLAIMLMLISHEHAHILACEKLGIKVNSVKFSFIGGGADFDIWYAHDIVEVLQSGITDTMTYTIAFGELLFILEIMQMPIEFRQFMRTVFIGALILFITNEIYPGTGDGAQVRRFRDLMNELPNDGRVIAQSLPASEYRNPDPTGYP